MGIFIHLSIAKSVTKEEWKEVYEESLQMVKAFPFAERRKINIDGIDTICLVKTEEHEETYGWHDEKIRVGWETDGDYHSMRTAEAYYLPRDLVEEEEYVEQCADAIFGVLPGYLDYDWEDKRFDFIYKLWGAKTQGEPYHIYLLAVACMIESRLGNKAFVYGDITKGQCERAVRLANKILDTPIHVPDRCDLEKLFKRVQTMPVTEKERLKIYECFYLGNQGKEFGEQIRKKFSQEVCKEYWEKRFRKYSMDQVGFRDALYEYILWGFELADLYKFVKFEDKEGIPQYEAFVKNIMDAKLHLQEKDCTDPLRIDQDEESPYSIYTLMAQFVFCGAKNRKIDRYIPIEEIREALVKGLGDKCDVNGIIDEYLEKEAEQEKIDVSKISTEEEYKQACEQDPSVAFKQLMDMKRDQLQKDQETYDVAEYDDLMFYKTGDTMHPDIMKSLGKSFEFYNSVLDEGHYKELMEKTPQKRCEFLIEQNRYILIRDTDWKKIFQDIHDHEDAYARYYPMVRVDINSDGIGNMIKGIVLNDDLYQYCFELAEKYGSEDDLEDRT